jgi:hypothetical protein
MSDFRRIAGFAGLAFMTTVATAQAGVLATPQQRAKEELTLRLKKTAVVQEQIKKVEALYGADPLAATPAGKATLKHGVDSLATAAVEYAANEDTDRPVAMWASTGPHEWFGYKMPGSGYGVDNPDNVYRMMMVNGAARYEIHGKVHKPGPAQETYVLYGSIPGVGETMNKEGRMIEYAGLQLDKMKVEPDGSFVITIDSDDANGRPNHMKTLADNPHMNLLVRDTLNDWATETPVEMEIRRVAGPPLKDPPTEEQMAKRAGYLISTMGNYWLPWIKRVLYAKPANAPPVPWRRATGWGYTAYGHFALGKDEVLVVTGYPMGAAYFAFQVADPWAVSYSYEHSLGSATQAQAKPNADGTYTYVVSANDPGVYNWITTDGHDAGTMQFRWQGMPPSNTNADGAVRSVKVVKLKDLKSALPPGTVFVTSEERKAQRAARAASFQRLLAEK